MASRTSGKGSQSTAGTSKKRAGQPGGAAKKAPAKKAAAKKAPAKKSAAPAKKAAPKKAAANAAPPKPAPSPTGGVFRAARAVWMGLFMGSIAVGGYMAGYVVQKIKEWQTADKFLLLTATSAFAMLLMLAAYPVVAAALRPAPAPRR